jgi:hypothetical protein
MDKLSKQTLLDLANDDSGMCFSFYIPTEKIAGREIRQNSIRLKNLLHKAQHELVRTGRRSSQMMERFKLVEALLGNEDFWTHQDEGLALFLSPATWQYYRLPMRFEEKLVVNSRFYLLPLMGLISYQLPFFALAISQNYVRFYHGDQNQIEELHPPTLPASLSEATWFREPDNKLLQFRQSASGGGNTRAGNYHGHGDDTRQADPELTIFLREVDKAISPYLRKNHGPLVLVGIEPTTGLFRKITSCHNVFPKIIHEKPELLSGQQIHDRVVDLLEPMQDRPIQEATQKYLWLAGNEPARAITDLDKILEAAQIGRVETLLVASGADKSDGFYERLNRRSYGSASYELVNAAAVDTVKTSGEVLPVEDLPFSRTGLAAMLRY